MRRFFTKYNQLLTLIGVSVIWFLIGWVARMQIQRTDTAVVEQVRQAILNTSLYTDHDSMALSYEAAHAMVAGIGDPHAGFLEPSLAARYLDDYNGNTGITGLLPELVDGVWTITVVLPGMAAERAGIQEGDQLISVDNIEISPDISTIEISLVMRGPVGKPAEIKVLRDGEVLTFLPIREVRTAVSAPSMIDGNIGYFAQYTFTTNAAELAQAALTELMAQNPSAIIWDLRSNGGGSMETAATILNEFIDEGVLFLAEMPDGQQQAFLAQEGGMATNVPVIILIAERTYSSAETAAITMREHGRAVLIGTTTHGKGTIQDTVPMPGGTALHLTVAKWLSPAGVWVDGVGVAPDIVVEDDPGTAADEVLETAVAYAQTHYSP